MKFLKKIFKRKEKESPLIVLKSIQSFLMSKCDKNIPKKFLQIKDTTTELVDVLINYNEHIAKYEHSDYQMLIDEVELLKNYMNVYKLLFEDIYIEYRIDIGNSKLYVPALITIPLVQNAFEYGYNSLAEYPVKVVIKAEGKSLWIEVSNKSNIYLTDQKNTIIMDCFNHRLYEKFGDKFTFFMNGNSNIFKSYLKIEF